MNSTGELTLLNGSWNYVTDAKEKMTYEEVSRLFKHRKTKKIKIPVNWELAGLHNFSGSIWFARTFKSNHSSSRLNILEFKGVDYFAEVWLNDVFLGKHEGYFQSFYFDVSDLLRESGKNFLIVKVNSPLEEPKKVWPYKKRLIKGIFNHHDCRPGAWSYKYGQDQNTGGIWNEVVLHSVNEVFIENVRVRSRIYFNQNKALLNLSISFYKRTKAVIKDKMQIRVTSPSGKIINFNQDILLRGIKGDVDFMVVIKNPELWWSWDLGKPNLYELNISGKSINIKNIKFGIREVGINGKKEFYLNGKRLFLRGTNVIPTLFLSELNEKKIEDQLGLIKDANINIIRMHAHVNRTEYYEECDKQGILIWQDFALQWTYNESQEFILNAVLQIKEMVALLFNHPSIAFWCCHNEPGRQIESLDPFLFDAVRSIDKSRIIRVASNYEEHPYDGWYWGNKEHFAARPMGPLVTEFGAQALPEQKSLKKIIPETDLSDPSKDSWGYHDFQYEQTFKIADIDKGKSLNEFINNSQDYQSELLRTAIDFYRRGKNKDITGIFQFMFIDCWPSITWSIIDYYGRTKKGYFTLQKCFQPLYVSVRLGQRKYFSGQTLNIDYWIINDFHEKFSSCKIVFSIGEKTFLKLPVDNIPEDSITHIDRATTEIKLPHNLRKGKYKIDIEIIQNKSVLSKNDFKIEIVNR